MSNQNFQFSIPLSSVFAESHNRKELTKLKEDLDTAIDLLERNFPISIQVCNFTTIFSAFIF